MVPPRTLRGFFLSLLLAGAAAASEAPVRLVVFESFMRPG